MRMYSRPMARPLTGARKRVRFNTTFDPLVVEKARACAAEQSLSLPQLIERLLEREISRNASLLKTDAVVRVAGERAGRTRKARRVTGR